MMEHAGGYDTYPFVAELYDHVVPYRNRQDVAFFVEMARQSDGAVLEIGCGTGRVLIPTARAGKEIIGLDLSEPMLAVCREKLSREPAEVQSRARLVQGDMRQFDLGREVGLVTLPFRPFQHLTTVE
jgi:ubiquinone/menaquinone biosynthesis C-methylase UbiE